MDFTILVVNGGGTTSNQEVRFRSDDGKAHGAIHYTDPSVFTKAVQGDALSIDIHDSGYAQTQGAGVPVVATTDAATGGQPATTQTAETNAAAPASTEAMATSVEAAPQPTEQPVTTRRSRTPQQ